MVRALLREIGDMRGGQVDLAMVALRRDSVPRQVVGQAAMAEAGLLRAIRVGERSRVALTCLAAGMSRRLPR